MGPDQHIIDAANKAYVRLAVPEAFREESLRICGPEDRMALKEVCRWLPRKIDGRLDLSRLTPQELRGFTNASTAWIPGGDHRWRHFPRIRQARIYAHQWNKFPRKNNAPECVHPLGSCDLLYNMKALFGVSLPQGLKMRTALFIMYFHDLVENNQNNLTVDQIIEDSWEIPENMQDPKEQEKWEEQKRLARFYLGKITDTPDRNRRERLQEQVDRANDEDPFGFLGQIRIIEKLNALIQDRIDIKEGFLPFGNLEKYQEYIFLRNEFMPKITAPGCEILNEVFGQYAADNLEQARHMVQKAKKSNKPLLNHKNRTSFVRHLAL